jgi:hypothetical protein
MVIHQSHHEFVKVMGMKVQSAMAAQLSMAANMEGEA